MLIRRAQWRCCWRRRPACGRGGGAAGGRRRPLSPAQVLLFETPHLQNVDQPETLTYAYVRDGAAGFADTVALHIRRVNTDGTKGCRLRLPDGLRRVAFPELDASAATRC